MNSLKEALIANKDIDAETYDMWYKRLFDARTDGIAPWDPWLDKAWREVGRNNFNDIMDYYNGDAWVVYQAAQRGEWKADAGQLTPFVGQGKSVLDFGCGHGGVGISCAQTGADVTFADVSQRLLNAIKTLCTAHDTPCTTQKITSEIPQLSGQFDVLVAMDVLEHVKRPVEVLSALVSNLKVNGILWMTVFFGGHEMSPYHLPENYPLGDQQVWSKVCSDAGLEPIATLDRVYRKVR